MIQLLQEYRYQAQQAYSTYTPPCNPDQAQRTVFIRPVPPDHQITQVVPTELGHGAIAVDLSTFIQQYPQQAATSIFAKAPAIWAHRQIYAYVDAWATRTLVVYIPAGVHLPEPVQLNGLFGLSELHNRYDACKIILADGAQATIVDAHYATDGTHVRSIIYQVGPRAQLTVLYDHKSQHQAESADAVLFACAKDSMVTLQCVIQTGIRSDLWLDILLQEPGAQATVRGIYALGAQSQLSMVTQQLHAAPNTTSELTLHGCLTGHAQATYHGRIHIDGTAQHAVAQQRNNTLLISDTARAVSTPTLEALAHQVHCVHASAVGFLDRQAVAYLVCRGIPEKRAQLMLIRGFLQASLGRCADLEPSLTDLLKLIEAY